MEINTLSALIMARRRIQSLAAKHPWRLDIPVLLLVSFALLAQALWMPIMEIRAFFLWQDEYSLISNIHHLYHHKKYTATLILTLCSIGYPAAKISALLVLWVIPFSAMWRSRFVRCLRLFGRWSMLDVFVVTSIVLGSQVIGPLESKPLPGIYVYVASIIVLAIATIFMDRLARRR